MKGQQRKRVRLAQYDYNTPGYYFLTVCTKEKRKLLGEILEGDIFTVPSMRESACGEIVRRRLMEMADFYEDVKLEKYVVMPNHVHLLIWIPDSGIGWTEAETAKESKVSRFVGTLKRLTNREYGAQIWQSRSYDHVVRGEGDYLKIWEYIDNNPAKWVEDCFYVP